MAKFERVPWAEAPPFVEGLIESAGNIDNRLEGLRTVSDVRRL